jgi:hypothetical protein
MEPDDDLLIVMLCMTQRTKSALDCLGVKPDLQKAMEHHERARTILDGLVLHLLQTDRIDRLQQNTRDTINDVDRVLNVIEEEVESCLQAISTADKRTWPKSGPGAMN